MEIQEAGEMQQSQNAQSLSLPPDPIEDYGA